MNGFFEYTYCTDGWSNSESNGLIMSISMNEVLCPNTDYFSYKSINKYF